jgi:hypothetical protein
MLGFTVRHGNRDRAWTLRNYRVFDQFVLVSTNGGFRVYGANNPRATGGYLERWPEDLMRMSELDADREGKRRAAAWIVANPARFLTLALEKNILFMGDDATGAYQTLKRGKGSPSVTTYAAAKAGSNLFWLATWALLLWGLLANWSRTKRNDPAALIVPLAFLYFLLLALHRREQWQVSCVDNRSPERSRSDGSDVETPSNQLLIVNMLNKNPLLTRA